jgi:hypothetical protein
MKLYEPTPGRQITMIPEIKTWKFRSLFLLSLACLAFAYSVMMTGKSTQLIQLEIQSQHERINRAAGSRKFLEQVLRDASEISLRDPAMANFLARHGVNVGATLAPPANPPSKSP